MMDDYSRRREHHHHHHRSIDRARACVAFYPFDEIGNFPKTSQKFF